MLRVDEARDAAPLLDLRHHVQGDGGLTGRFRSVDLHHAALRHAAKSQSQIQAQRAGGNGLHVHAGGRITEFHDGALAVGLLDLGQCRCQCFLFCIVIHISSSE